MVSIIIPVYNRADVIGRTIENIFKQTFTDIELIVVDDGSTDNLDEVIRTIREPRLRYIKTGVNKGACHARNVGIIESKGEYIAFQDSDDIWYPEKIRLQLDFLKQEDADICICGMKQIYENGTEKIFHSKNFSNKDITLENELGKSFLSTQLLLGKRECFEMERFDEQFPRFQDWDLGIRLVKSFKMVYLDEVLVERYLQKNSISNDWSRGYIAGKLLLEKYAEEYANYPKAESKFLTYYAQLQELNGESSNSNLRRALRLDFNAKTFIKYLFQSVGLYRLYLLHR